MKSPVLAILLLCLLTALVPAQAQFAVPSPCEPTKESLLLRAVARSLQAERDEALDRAAMLLEMVNRLAAELEKVEKQRAE